MNAPDSGRSEHGRSAPGADASADARARAAGGFPAPGGGGRGVGRSCEGGRILKPYYPASWFDSIGVKKVLNRLLPRLPMVAGSLWGTLTFDRGLFSSPTDAFMTGRDHIRKVFYALRHGVVWEGKRNLIDAPYCIKLEFHEDGWPHFHFIFLTRRFLPAELLTHMWGFGFTQVARISEEEFHYLLKYVTKDGKPPTWVLEFPRIRVFQTSPGFLKPLAKVRGEKTLSMPKRTRKVDTIGERLERWSKTATLTDGKKYRQVCLGRPFHVILAQEVMTISEEGRYLGNGNIIIGGNRDLRVWKIKK